jgi:hypothetical protein
LESALNKKVLDFENERSSLQTRIQSMCEDLKMRTEAQGKVDQLEVSVLLFSALFKRTEPKLLFLRLCLTTPFAFITHIPFHNTDWRVVFEK